METTRRSFLGALAVASALSGATAAQAVVRGPVDADLIALGKVFDEAHAHFLAMSERLTDFQEAYRAIAPRGEGLVAEEHKRGANWSVMDFFQDPASPTSAIMRANNGFRLMKVCSYSIERQIESGALYDTPRIRDLRKAAVQFEADIDAAVKSSGLDSALNEYWAAETELRKVIMRLVEHRASSMDGIAVKIRATAAYAALGSQERHSASLWLSNAIWTDLEGEVPRRMVEFTGDGRYEVEGSEKSRLLWDITRDRQRDSAKEGRCFRCLPVGDTKPVFMFEPHLRTILLRKVAVEVA